MQCSHFPYINFQISLITLIRRGSAYLQQPYPLQPDMRLDPLEAGKGFRGLKAYKQLPVLKATLLAHRAKHAITNRLENRQAA